VIFLSVSGPSPPPPPPRTARDEQPYGGSGTPVGRSGRADVGKEQYDMTPKSRDSGAGRDLVAK
jgi:hypothetical protein